MDDKPIGGGGGEMQRALVGAVFWVLGRAICAASKLDSHVRAEVNSWDDGTTITMRVDPEGPVLSLLKKGSSLVTTSLEETPTLEIAFKNIGAAFMVLTGKLGIDNAFAQHRFYMKGDIGLGLSLVRCLYIVEAYLFPGFMSSRILKIRPPKSRSSLRVYIATLLGV